MYTVHKMASNITDSKYKFMSPPEDDLICLICLEVAEEPWQHGECGRLLCKKCLNKLGRKKPCPNCREENPKYFTDSRSKRAIQALAVKCSNAKCDWVGTVSTLKDHETKCEFVTVRCKYRGLGCKEKLTRSDKTAHEEDDKLHLHMAIETIKQLKEERVKTLLKDEKSITFKVEDCDEKIKNKYELYTQTFYTSSEGYRVVVNIEFSDDEEGRTSISVYLCILNGDNDKKLRWPFIGWVTFSLLNQLENANHNSVILSVTTEDQLLVNKSLGFTHHFLCSELGHDPIENTQYLKDDTLYFRVSFALPDQKPWLECNASTRTIMK